jgi:hypothetical protein
MNRLVSLRDFLTTGSIGELRPGLTLNEIAKLLGPPAVWIDEREGIPLYWSYSLEAPRLEISFESDAPHKCRWFQIELAGHLEGEFASLTREVFMTLDGLSGRSKISDFIAAIPDRTRVRVQMDDGAGYLGPSVLVEGGCRIGFEYRERLGEPDFPLAAFRDNISSIEANFELMDIYSPHDASDWSEEFLERVRRHDERFAATTITGEEYLALLGGKRAKDS